MKEAEKNLKDKNETHRTNVLKEIQDSDGEDNNTEQLLSSYLERIEELALENQRLRDSQKKSKLEDLTLKQTTAAIITVC